MVCIFRVVVGGSGYILSGGGHFFGGGGCGTVYNSPFYRESCS